MKHLEHSEELIVGERNEAKGDGNVVDLHGMAVK